MPLPGLRLPASASLPLASCWPRPQQLLPVSAAGGGRRRCSQRERLWQAGPLPTGRRRPDMAQKGGPRLRGQRLLDNAPCQAAVNLGSSALLFPRHRASLVQTKADRHANGSPSGRAGERSETERASPGQKSFCAAISRFFVRAILSLCKSCLAASLPSPSLLRNATSPKGRGFHAAEREQKAPRIPAGGLESLMLFYQTG